MRKKQQGEQQRHKMCNDPLTLREATKNSRTKAHESMRPFLRVTMCDDAMKADTPTFRS